MSQPTRPEEKKSIEVLQLADLLIAGKDDRRIEVYMKRLLKYLVVAPPRKFDYVVISGNVTAARNVKKTDQFEKALEVLKTLSEKVLKTPQEWTCRTLVVPGPCDATGERVDGKPLDFSEFNEFYKRLSSKGDYDYHSLKPCWHTESGVYLAVRVLPEFTSVGFFWDRRLAQAHGGADELLWRPIAQQRHTWSSNSSLLLMSSCVPQEVALENYLKDCTYLVGRTPHAMLQEVRYNALNWRVALDLPVKPNLKGNVHRFECNGDGLRHRAQTFDFEVDLPGQVTPISPADVSTTLPPNPGLFSDVLERLYNKLCMEWENGERDRDLHIVRGVPGAGKNQFFEKLRAATSRDFAESTTEVPCFLIQPVELWEGEILPAKIVKKLEHYSRLLKDRLSRCLKPLPGIILVFDHNQSMGGMAQPGNNIAGVTNLVDLLRAFDDTINDLPVPPFSLIYLTNAEGDLEVHLEASQNNQDESGKKLRKIEISWLQMGKKAFDRLLNIYPNVPCNSIDLARLSGRLCGFGKRLIDAVLSESNANRADGQVRQWPTTRVERWKSLVAIWKDSELIKNSFYRFKNFLTVLMRVENLSDESREQFDRSFMTYAQTLRNDPFAPLDDDGTLKNEEFVALANEIGKIMTKLQGRFKDWGLDDAPNPELLPLLPYMINDELSI